VHWEFLACHFRFELTMLTILTKIWHKFVIILLKLNSLPYLDCMILTSSKKITIFIIQIDHVSYTILMFNEIWSIGSIPNFMILYNEDISFDVLFEFPIWVIGRTNHISLEFLYYWNYFTNSELLASLFKVQL